MLLSPRSQLYLTTTLLLLTIGSYISIYSQPFSPSALGSQSHSQPHTELGSVNEADGVSSLGLVLNPEAHIHREPQTIHHVWNITSDIRAPDGVEKRVYLINELFPGPLIEARSGDEIVIKINNGLENEGTAIHWHGLSMRGKLKGGFVEDGGD